MYGAYAFAAKQPFGSSVGTGGTLLLDGTTHYDACPQYLVTNFMPATTKWGPDLALSPCREDLRQDRTPTCTKAKFDVWNENEVKFTGAYQCIKCWFEGELDDLGTLDKRWGTFTGFGGDKFTFGALRTEVARFRVQGVASSVCKGKFMDGKTDLCPNGAAPSPLLGVLLFNEYLGPSYSIPVLGIAPTGAGLDGSGFIQWDTAGSTPEAPKQ